MFCWPGLRISFRVKFHGKHADKIGPVSRRIHAGRGRPDRFRSGLLIEPVQNTAPLFDDPTDRGTRHPQLALDFGNCDLLIQQLHQGNEHTQRNAGDAQKRMGKDGKRPSALVMFAKVALNIDSLLTAKTVSLVSAIFDNIVLIVAPMTSNRPGVIFLGNLVQIQ